MRNIGWFVLTVVVMPSLVQAQTTCTTEPTRAFRGETVRLVLPADTAAKDARVTLRPQASQGAVSAAPSQPAPTGYGGESTVRITNGTSSFVVDPTAPLGRYTVAVALDEQPGLTCGTLQVALPENWKLTLAEFNPKGTFDISKTKIKRDSANVEVKTITLSLRGTGFLKDVPQDNRLFINGTLRPVIWDGCPLSEPVGEAPPNPLPVHGHVLNSEHIELCQVELPGSHREVDVEMSQEGAPRTAVRTFRVYWWDRKIVGTIAAAVAVVLAALVLFCVGRLRGSQPDPSTKTLEILFLDPETDTYSLSKLQFYLWTFAALFGYVYLSISRLFIQGESWPDIPDGLPAVIALGAGTAIGTQIVNSTKGPKGAGAESPNIGDFVTSGGVAAPERVQMLVWTIVGVLVFIQAVLQHGPEDIQALDPVPTGLLYMMGLSSLGYLGGKMARAVGPIINEISIVPAESDETLQRDHAAPLPDLSSARSAALLASARLTTAGGAAAKPALEALNAGATALNGPATLAAIQAAAPVIEQHLVKAEAAAAAAAEAVVQPNAPADAMQAAQTAQGAAAALQDLLAAVRIAAGTTPAAGIRTFSRVIELRGRNLSLQALFSIDKTELPFRMLRPDRNGKCEPEVVIREKNDPNLAVALRLIIDPMTLEAPDLRRYHQWFGAESAEPKTFSITNLDGQRADITFSVPPASAQKSSDTAQKPSDTAQPPSGTAQQDQ